jgi:RNA polymerase sigma-70 factor (ECF subfamily)
MSADIYNDLLARCALRDENALEELYKRASPRLYALALSVVKRSDWAEEVLQDAFVKVWTHADSFRPDKSGSMTWISTIVRNRAVDKLRTVQRNPLLQEGMLEETGKTPLISENANPDDFALMSQDMQALINCLGTLDFDQKRAVLMSYYHGYSHQELSDKLEKPLGTVKGWVRRGLEKLRLCLGMGSDGLQ